MKTLTFTIPVMIIIVSSSLFHSTAGVQILSKSKLEKCEKVSDSGGLNCTAKVVIDLAVPSGSSGREASIVAELVEVEENLTAKMRTLRVPPVITVNKSAAYACYELTYIRDLPYRPEELYVKTRKCEPDAGADVVNICERLRDDKGHIIENTQPTCCPCGDQRRVPSSCGNFCKCSLSVVWHYQNLMQDAAYKFVAIDYFYIELVDKMMKGKANTAHCLRFPGDWFHVFGIGQRSVGFSVRIEVKTGSKLSEVVVGPENRTAISNDNFLRVNLIGDYVGYTNIPSFDNYYLVIPRQGSPGEPQNLGRNYSMWMLLERVRFTLDGLECNKIGVSYEAFNGQPDFCSAPLWSCLHNQLWNFWDADQNRLSRKQVPLYGVQGRFERINQHPVMFQQLWICCSRFFSSSLYSCMQNAGSHSFSIGLTEVLSTNLLIELSADDIEYVYQRSPGKILSINVPTFEALTQFGTATITTKNIGEVEASYSLTFDCSKGVSQMEEQFYIMKPQEVMPRSFKLYPTTDQAARYLCSAILKDSDFREVDRAECQFTTTATVLDNGSQLPFQPPKTSINGFFESIESLWNNMWNGLADFITGKTCRRKCTGFFDFSCHIQYICMSWVLMFGLLLAIFPTVIVLLWLLHQKGLFDPFYDWWEDHCLTAEQSLGDVRRNTTDADLPQIRFKKYYKQEAWHPKNVAHKKRKSRHTEHRHKHSDRDSDYYYHLHRVHKDRHKHGKIKGFAPQVYMDEGEHDIVGHHRRRKEREPMESKPSRHSNGSQAEYYKHKHLMDETHYRPHAKRMG
ncbi:hypothetical protein RJ639_042319 [Escallonia herrerae]|uniref:Generative cell specific-1/HAP2 domain-containing protein n=1 Tax=Escallonia herrerae TaxID=1293975 RepID=A0AA88WL69_9ASTE|nr:hypothetical protein RJ639_042319 [Escallonia herrerae]